ncbi:tail fiber domain-containing protein [Winogradskyella sp.]|uniref:tail fiber domain-containing protein n=1 Tax=Winogradskyella sp. TaxID=1883156 RepID=UPI003BAD9635
MKLKITLLSLLFTLSITAQNGINYKALIKDTNGNVVANQAIDFQFSIQFSGGTIFYEEDQTATTDQNGIARLEIGEGTSTLGDFATIPWERANVLHIQIDLEQDGTFVDFGDEPISAIPRSFYASRAGEADNVSGLELINEGGNDGWRLVGRDPDFYTDIGDNAVDLSTSFNANPSTQGGAVGDFSLASGLNTTASGNFATATGQNTLASGGTSTAMGIGTTASGAGATAMGNGTTASGSLSTALGINTVANSQGATAIGRYNVGGGNPTEWNNNDPLFEIGNGTSNSERSNALTVIKSGRHTINSTSDGLRITSAFNGIVINHEPINGINAAFNGILIPDGIDTGISIQSPSINGIRILDSQSDAVFASSDNYGGAFFGDTAGLYASGDSNADNVPDIILGSSNNSSLSANGIISTNPERGGSDMFLRSYDAVVVQLDYNENEAGNFLIRSGQNTTSVFNVNESGNVEMGNRLQIGTETIEDTGSNQLSVNASLIPDNDNSFRLGNPSNRWTQVWATDGTINTSDRREKKNIKALHYGLHEVLQMQPVSFNWKSNSNPDTKLGLIAQDLQAIIPEVVKSHSWETDEATGSLIKKELERLGVYYSDLVPVLINAIQEQQELIENLKATVHQQNKQNLTLQETLEALLARVDHLEQAINQ